ncbi:serine/threonine-protein phosphatase [Oxalobacteraceae bacterium]|nr:serine/threonine-protein phosphatase [Oxalobacteraceae bacterium]
MQLSPTEARRLPLGLACGVTDAGTVRSANQDNFLIAPDLGLLAVADGMGGHDAGDIASADALTLLYSFIQAARADQADSEAKAPPDRDATVPAFRASAFNPALTDPDATWTDATMKAMITLHDAVEYANDRVYQNNLVRGMEEGSGMGTTLTGLWQVAPDGPVFVFHIGDSRLYCWRQGRLQQITRDQTLYQQALESGAFTHLPARNLLLQALGPGPDIKPDLLTQVVVPGDVYLLCSDGLYGESSDAAIGAIMAGASAATLPACCAQLIDLAKRDGSRDNITAVLLMCDGSP